MEFYVGTSFRLFYFILISIYVLLNCGYYDGLIVNFGCFEGFLVIFYCCYVLI